MNRISLKNLLKNLLKDAVFAVLADMAVRVCHLLSLEIGWIHIPLLPHPITPPQASIDIESELVFLNPAGCSRS